MASAVLEREDFSLSEYDDVIVQQILKEVRIVDTQTDSIRFLGGIEMTRKIR